MAQFFEINGNYYELQIRKVLKPRLF